MRILTLVNTLGPVFPTEIVVILVFEVRERCSISRVSQLGLGERVSEFA